MRPRVLVLRGHQVNPWELGPWELLLDRYDAHYLRTGSGWFNDSLLSVPAQPARALRDLLPAGRVGNLAVRLPGDRYLGLAATLRGAQIVHTQELGYWYSMQAARLKRRLGYKLLTTVWETIPFLGAYRNARTRPYRRAVLAETDLFLAATERARAALLLEGVAPERIRVSPPGVDVDRFRRARGATAAPASHVVLSPGRLVWEKGHQDVLRAVAAIRGGLVSAGVEAPRIVFAGSGADEPRLRAYARELGVDDLADFRSFVAYEEMPDLFARASCVVLASLPRPHWEEQFGMVLAEALASRTAICAADSGAIAEVLQGAGALFAPGDWLGLAGLLIEGPLARPPGARADHDPGLVSRYSNAAAAERLADAYQAVLR